MLLSVCRPGAKRDRPVGVFPGEHALDVFVGGGEGRQRGLEALEHLLQLRAQKKAFHVHTSTL